MLVLQWRSLPALYLDNSPRVSIGSTCTASRRLKSDELGAPMSSESTKTINPRGDKGAEPIGLFENNNVAPVG